MYTFQKILLNEKRHFPCCWNIEIFLLPAINILKTSFFITQLLCLPLLAFHKQVTNIELFVVIRQ